MYQPSAFQQSDSSQLHGLIQAYPFASLVFKGESGIVANHLPLLLRRRRNGCYCLVGHLARANPACDGVRDKGEALVIFHGPQGYVSPNWYPSKARDGRAVPTWNYAVVHAHGTLSLVDDPRWLRSLLSLLTDRMERDFEPPWRLEDAPADYRERMIAATVGVHIKVERLEGKWKLSQNQQAENRGGVISGLRGRNEDSLADWVESSE